MKNTTIFAFLLLLSFAFFSCSNEDEETPDLSVKETVKVSLGSLKINQSDAISGRTSAIPASVEFIDVVYGPFPDFVSSNPGDITERVIESFPVDEFPDNYTIELEKDREYYVAIAAYSLNEPRPFPIYEINASVSGTQPVIYEVNDDLKSDLYAFSKVFTAEDNMDINAILNRVSVQFRIQMPDGVDLPSNAVKGEVSINDECQDALGAIDLELVSAGDICDEFTFRFTADLTTAPGINTIFHTMPFSESGALGGNRPLQISVKLFDALDAVIAEGSAQLDTLAKNRLYNFVLDPTIVDQSISIDVDETIQEEVDIIVE